VKDARLDCLEAQRDFAELVDQESVARDVQSPLARTVVPNSSIDPITGGNSRRLQPGACRPGRAVIVSVVDPFEMLWSSTW
jgi:hypothetical protein